MISRTDSGPPIRSIRAVIFDFDGTLTPLTLDFPLLRAAVEDIARRFVGEHVIQSQKNEYIIEMIHAVEDDIAHKGASFREAAFAELDRLEIEACRNKELYPFTRDVLAALKANEVCLGVITRSSVKVIQTVFPDVKEYIDIIVTRDDTRYVKPNPEQLKLAVDALCVRPEDAIIVGDHPTDIAAGVALGTKSAGVLSGRCTAGQFRDARADYIFEDIRSILSVIW